MKNERAAPLFGNFFKPAVRRRRAETRKIKDGDVLRVFGEPYRVSQSDVGGAPEFLDRRVRDKIKRRFLLKAREIIREMPPGLHPKRITVRDTTSRWGSCSASGAMSLSWRLSFAPPEIMRYVVIHECCHLREMNHSPRFWALVEKHYPDYKKARLWLRENGEELFRQ